MSNNWWAQKLGGQQPAPAQAPQARPVTPQAPSLPPTQPTAPLTPRCPGCNSVNYSGTGESRPRCYDCGYPLQQSGSGMGRGVSVPMEGPTQAAKQIETGGWNPQGIIGKLG
jgi:hypothetical protein